MSGRFEVPPAYFTADRAFLPIPRGCTLPEIMIVIDDAVQARMRLPFTERVRLEIEEARILEANIAARPPGHDAEWRAAWEPAFAAQATWYAQIERDEQAAKAAAEAAQEEKAMPVKRDETAEEKRVRVEARKALQKERFAAFLARKTAEKKATALVPAKPRKELYKEPQAVPQAAAPPPRKPGRPPRVPAPAPVTVAAPVAAAPPRAAPPAPRAPVEPPRVGIPSVSAARAFFGLRK